MKKLLTVAAIALVAMSCNKNPQEQPTLPGSGANETPISFGGSANVDISPAASISKASTTLGGATNSLNVNLGIYAFKSATVPADGTAATNAVWSGGSNLEYRWSTVPDPDCYTEFVDLVADATAKPKLFWPGSGTTGNNLTFVSYFPFVATGATMPATGKQQAYVADYKLKADLTNQLAQGTAPNKVVYDYAFAWATPKIDITRPSTIVSQDLTYAYKVTKLSLEIKGDGSTIGSAGLKVSVGGAKDEGIKSIKIYAKAGLNRDYELDLLKGTVAKGSTAAVKATPISFEPVADAGNASASPSPILPFVKATGYLVPAAAADLTDGILIEVVYNDGVADQTYTAEISKAKLLTGTNGNTADSNLTNGLKEATNYKYSLKLGKSGITLTGKVTDWVDVSGGADMELE